MEVWRPDRGALLGAVLATLQAQAAAPERRSTTPPLLLPTLHPPVPSTHSLCSCGRALSAPAGLRGDQTRLDALEEHKVFLGHRAPKLQGSCKMSVMFFLFYYICVGVLQP